MRTRTRILTRGRNRQIGRDGFLGRGGGGGALSINVTSQPTLNIANLVAGAQIGASWVSGSYSAPTGTCNESVPVYRVNGQTVAASYVIQTGDTIEAASVLVTAPSLSQVFQAFPAPFSTFQVSAADFRGFQATANYGTAGDVFVAPGGSDGNAGTLAAPYATIAYAALNNPGKTIRVRGGTYPPVRLGTAASGTAGARTRILRYADEDPVVRGSSALSGLARCTSADAADVGPLWANVFVATVSVASIASGHMDAANPVENGTPLALAGDFGGSKSRWPVEVQCVYDNDNHTPVLNAGNIEGYQWPELAAYPAAQVQAARVYYYGYPNVGAQSLVESYAGGVLTLVNKSTVYSTTAYKDRVSIRNIPAAIQRGQWAYILQPGGTTAKLYIWPLDEASVGAGIRVATSNYLLDLNGVQHLDIKGIRFDHCASASLIDYDGETGISDTTSSGSNVTIENFELTNVFRPRVRHNGGIYIVRLHNFTLDQFSVRGIYGCFGLMMTGGSIVGLAELMQNALVRRGRFEDIGYSSIRAFSSRKCAVFHCEFAASCGICPHSNKCNFYSVCYECIWFGIMTLGAFGYITWQESVAIDCINTYALGNMSADDARAIQDQNTLQGNGKGDPIYRWPGAGLDGTSYFIGCRFDGDPKDPLASTGVAIGLNANMPIQIDNCILDGSNAIGAYATRSKNIVTNGGLVAQEIAESRANAYEDFAAGDIRIKPTSAIRSTVGNDKTATIAILKARYPHVPVGDWDLDINGNALNWAAPPMGPAVDFTLKTTGATFVTASIPAAPALVGQPATWTPGYHQPFWLTPTYAHYRKLPGDLVWTLIPGQTGAAYTPVAGDTGYLLAREAHLNGARSFCVNSVAVSNSYAIADPVQAMPPLVTTANGTQFESATFTLQNRPLLVRIKARPNAATTFTVTIGAPGRAAGTGTVVATCGSATRTVVSVSAAFLAAPGTGAVTVQVTASTTVSGIIVTGDYFDGATAASALGSTGLTSAAVDHTRTTAKTNCMVCYVGGRTDGRIGAAALTGATQTYEGASGSAADDVEGVDGHEQSPNAANYAANMNGVSSASIILGSVILESAASA